MCARRRCLSPQRQAKNATPSGASSRSSYVSESEVCDAQAVVELQQAVRECGTVPVVSSDAGRDSAFVFFLQLLSGKGLNVLVAAAFSKESGSPPAIRDILPAEPCKGSRVPLDSLLEHHCMPHPAGSSIEPVMKGVCSCLIVQRCIALPSQHCSLQQAQRAHVGLDGRRIAVVRPGGHQPQVFSSGLRAALLHLVLQRLSRRRRARAVSDTKEQRWN